MTFTSNNTDEYVDIDKIAIVDNVVYGAGDAMYVLEQHGKNNIIARTLYIDTYIPTLDNAIIIDLNNTTRSNVLTVIKMFKYFKQKHGKQLPSPLTISFHNIDIAFTRLVEYRTVDNEIKLGWCDDGPVYYITYNNGIKTDQPIGIVVDGVFKIPDVVSAKYIDVYDIKTILKYIL